MLKMIFCRTCKIRHFLAFLLFLFIQVRSIAQSCTGCTTLITTNTTANITVGPSDIVCIAPGVFATGNITLNGGTLCNQGTITDVTFIEGIFNNYGTFSKTTGNLNFTNAKNLKINCYENSVFDVVNALNIDGATNSDSIAITVFAGNAMFSIGKDLSISKGWLKITHSINDGSGGIAIGSIFNIGGQLNVNNSMLKLRNYGTFNVNKAINLEGKFTKEIYNYDNFNCNNSLNISGNGQNTATITINNYSFFNITKHLNSSYNNGVVNITNDLSGGFGNSGFINAFFVGKSVTLGKDNNNFNNTYGEVFVLQDVNVERGSVINTGTITARDFDIKFGVYTNNNVTISNRDFLITNNSGIVNDNGYISVAREFNNVGTFNMGLTCYLKTTKYYNLVNGTINGPASIANDGEYAKIFIPGESENTGYINGKVLIYDQTLTGTSNNNGYGFDQVTNGSRISSNTAFAAKSAGPGGPIAINCVLLQSIFAVYPAANPNTICPGSSSNLYADFNHYVVVVSPIFGTITLLTPIPLAGTAYTWTPASSLNCSNCQNPIASPLTTTQYTVKATHAGCTFTNVVTVNVGSSIVVNTPTTYYTTANSPVQLGSNPIASGGTAPYTYAWAGPSFSSILQNPIITTGVNATYNLTVTDATGCNTTQPFNVIIVNTGPHAVFKRQLDAGYYQLTGGKLYFTLDGEYNSSTLNYKVIDEKRAIVTTPLPPTLTLNNGDNRYLIDLTTVGFSTANNGKFYTLEVLNEKSELFLLKIRYAQ